MKRLIFLILFLPYIISCSDQGMKAGSTDMKVDSLLSIMTLEEKIGQMNLYNGFWEVTGPPPVEGNSKMKYDHLKNGLVGGMLGVVGTENVRELQELVVNESRLGIPLIFGYDVIHGHKTLSPIPLAEAASWDMAAIEKSARIAAIEASSVGLNWAFAPMMDISRDARWGRVMEGGGEDPFLGSKVAVARVKGFQGDDLSAHNTIAACAKHFAAYGFSESGKDYNTVDIGTSALYNFVLPPFKAAVDNDVKTVMNSFNVLNGIPVTGNSFLQQEILKEKWGFEGFIVSDWATAAQMITHGFATDLKDAAEKSIEAGMDMDMESYAFINHLKTLVEEGKVDETLIDDAVRRILSLKFELGLFDDPYKYCDPERENEMLYHRDHQEASLDLAKKSIVLLKNNGSLLPISKDQKKIAVIGALADDKNSPLGSWRLASDDNTSVSVLEGLKEYTDEITYSKGADLVIGEAGFRTELEINEADKSGFAEAIKLAKSSEIVIMVLGEHSFQSGEGRSRTRLDLPGVQQELLEAVYEVNKNIVLVLMNGRPLTIPWAAKKIPSILEAWHLGSQSGHAIAQVLFGDYNPSGKLPMTFPRSVGQVPIYYNHYSTGRADSVNMVFWTHFSDELNSPQYPFGHGLSYTDFEYSNLRIDTTDIANIKVMVTVKNAGDIAGEEVTQLYIQDKFASVVRPVKELKGFKKFKLEPGQTMNVEFTLTDKELGFYDNDGNYVVEPGEFKVMVGTSSSSVLSDSFNLK